MGSAWLVGAIINLVGSICVNLGTNVMKLGHNKRAAMLLPEEQKPAIRSFREWQLGFGLFMTGNVANFISFGFAAQSLLAALGSVQFVSNVAFASLVLKETITKEVLLATFSIVAGCIILVVFGNHHSVNYTVHDLMELYKAKPYIIYVTLNSVMIMGCYICYWHGKRLVCKRGPRAPVLWVSLLPVMYSSFAALVGTQSVLFSKSLSTLLRTTFNGDNQLGNWYTWVVLPLFICCSTFWVTRLNKGLKLFPAVIIVPTMQIAWTLFSIVCGMIYFQEYKGFTIKKGCLFGLGVLVLFVGVCLLTRSNAPRSKLPTNEEYVQRLTAHSLQHILPPDRSHSPLLSTTPGGATHTVLPVPQSMKDIEMMLVTPPEESGAEKSASGPGPDGPTGTEKLKLTSPFQQSQEEPGGLEVFMQGGLTCSQSLSRKPSMVQRIVSVSAGVKHDFDLDKRVAARLAFGLGDGDMPALSFLTIPMVDMYTPNKEGSGIELASRQSSFISKPGKPQHMSINPLENAASVRPSLEQAPPSTKERTASLSLEDTSLYKSVKTAVTKLRGLGQSSDHHGYHFRYTTMKDEDGEAITPPLFLSMDDDNDEAKR